MEIESSEKDCILFFLVIFFTCNLLFFSAVPSITIHSLSVRRNYIFLVATFFYAEEISSTWIISLRGQESLFFFVRTCQMIPAALKGGSGNGIKRELVSEVTKRIGELPGRCKERRNLLKVSW